MMPITSHGLASDRSCKCIVHLATLHLGLRCRLDTLGTPVQAGHTSDSGASWPHFRLRCWLATLGLQCRSWPNLGLLHRLATLGLQCRLATLRTPVEAGHTWTPVQAGHTWNSSAGWPHLDSVGVC
jgi:hypothetical protein